MIVISTAKGITIGNNKTLKIDNNVFNVVKYIILAYLKELGLRIKWL